MLVLSRKKFESIFIGQEIEVVVVDVRDGKVRLGISAPREIPVHRSEVVERIADEAEQQRLKRIELLGKEPQS